MAEPVHRSWTSLVAGVLGLATAALALLVGIRDDDVGAGLVVGVLATVAAGVGLPRRVAAIRRRRRRVLVLAGAAALLWGLGIVGVFSALFLLLVPALLATGAAVRAGWRQRALGGLLALGGVVLGAAATIAFAVVLADGL